MTGQHSACHKATLPAMLCPSPSPAVLWPYIQVLGRILSVTKAQLALKHYWRLEWIVITLVLLEVSEFTHSKAWIYCGSACSSTAARSSSPHPLRCHVQTKGTQ